MEGCVSSGRRLWAEDEDPNDDDDFELEEEEGDEVQEESDIEVANRHSDDKGSDTDSYELDPASGEPGDQVGSPHHKGAGLPPPHDREGVLV